MVTLPIPDEPICRAPDETQPCPYWRHCHEGRQRTQSGMRKTETGRWATVRAPLRGDACWAFQSFRDKNIPISTEPIAEPSPREPGDEPARPF